MNGGKITGEYTYEDPVGSTIVVSYSMNLDKTNYVEERKVYKKYVNSGQDTPQQGGLTAEQVVERVLRQITPTTLQVIRSSVQGRDASHIGTFLINHHLQLHLFR